MADTTPRKIDIPMLLAVLRAMPATEDKLIKITGSRATLYRLRRSAEVYLGMRILTDYGIWGVEDWGALREDWI